MILTLRNVDFAACDAIVGPAGLLTQLQVVTKYVESVVLIVRLQQLLLALLQVAVVFGDDTHRGPQDEKDVLKRELHRL